MVHGLDCGGVVCGVEYWGCDFDSSAVVGWYCGVGSGDCAVVFDLEG